MPDVPRLLRYAATGVATALVYIVGYNGLLMLGAPRWLASLTAYLVAVAFQYVAHSRFTFQKRMSEPGQLQRFISATVLGLSIAVTASALNHFFRLDDWLLSFLIAGGVAALNYVLFGGWVFAAKRSVQTPAKGVDPGVR